MARTRPWSQPWTSSQLPMTVLTTTMQRTPHRIQCYTSSPSTGG
jgi:hypothetical protein